MNKKITGMILALSMICSMTACAGTTPASPGTAAPSETAPAVTEAAAETVTEAVPDAVTETEPAAETSTYPLEYWAEDSAAAKSLTEFVASVTDETSGSYVPETERIAVFDVDGTLFGELFPIYFDQCLMMHRILHDEDHVPSDENKAIAEEQEKAVYAYEPEPDCDKSSGQILAEECKGMTVEEYRAYVRDFMSERAYGFEGMTYGEAFYKPMVSAVRYLAENGFQVYLISGQERSMLREVTKDTLGEWIPSDRIIGTTFSLVSEKQGDASGKSYNMEPGEQLVLEGNMTFKSKNLNKVFAIIDEIGSAPILSFGNSSGDISMAQYTVDHGGKAYMLLCDDTERDYGNIETAQKFEEKCKARGFETVSMKDEFTTIYGENVIKIRENE